MINGSFQAFAVFVFNSPITGWLEGGVLGMLSAAGGLCLRLSEVTALQACWVGAGAGIPLPSLEGPSEAQEGVTLLN